MANGRANDRANAAHGGPGHAASLPGFSGIRALPRNALKTLAVAGDELSPATLQAMIELRRSIMQMKPGIDLARDFDKFCRFCRRARRVVLLYAPGQQLVGSMVFVADEKVAGDGTPYVAVQIEYVFMAAAYRGHVALPLALLRLVLRFLWHGLWHWRGRQLWLCGVGYPASLVFFNDLLPQSYLGLAPEKLAQAPLVAREILQDLVRQCGSDGWDAVHGRAIMPTLPPQMPPHWHEKMRLHPLYQAYVSLCPDWAAGFALPGTGRLRWGATLWRIVGKGLTRSLRRD